MILINKQACDKMVYRREFSFYQNARTAWGDIINNYIEKDNNTVFFLPAYIGFSNNGGSGIFDPIRSNKANFEFYNLGRTLEIDIDDLKNKVDNCKGTAVVLLVHYFGFPDKNYSTVCDWLDSLSITFIEDCAHAMLSDLVGGCCGKRAIYTYYSIDKMLPYNYGGILTTNNNGSLFPNRTSTDLKPIDIFSFDLYTIYKKRRENYLFLISLIKDFEGIEILYPDLPQGVGPQTLPVLIKSLNRDDVYFKMNASGFGFVSLYHTLIEELKDSNSDSATITAKHITNLPVHQDCSKIELKKMADTFKSVLKDI